MRDDDLSVATSRLAALVEGLAGAEVTQRRSAAKALLDTAAGDVMPIVLAWPIPALERALDDADEETRRTAALALLARSWLNGPLTRVVPYLDEGYASPDAEVRREAHAATLAAARVHGDAKQSAQLVLPVFDLALRKGDLGLQRDALLTLERLGNLGADLTPLVPTLDALLGHPDPGVVAYALSVLQPLARRIGDVENLAPLLARPDKGVQHGVARVIAASALAHGDAVRLSGLLTHASAFVREGAADAVSAAAGQGELIAVAISALAGRLADPAGGVAFKSLRALLEAALGGEDVSDAVPGLEQALAIGAYPAEGWMSGPLDLVTRSELGRLSPAQDAAAALTAHWLNAGDVAPVEALLSSGNPRVVTGAIQVLGTAIRVPRWEPVLAGVNALLEKYAPE